MNNTPLSQVLSEITTGTIARPAVEAEGLVKIYPGGVQALKGVSLNVRPGTVFALLGPNGAGKSTMVKILTTLSRPTTGRASMDTSGRQVQSSQLGRRGKPPNVQ